MPKPTVSQRGTNVIASPIRKFLPLMQATENRGVEVYKLNTGDPDLTVPQEFFAAVRAYDKPNLGYAPSPGIAEHVTAWQEYYRQFGVTLAPQQIIPTVGCAEAIALALMAVADFGDEILVFEPLYVSYKAFAVMLGLTLVPVTLHAEDGFTLPPVSEIESKISKKTRAIVVINPDNPTGKLWSEDELAQLTGLAKKHGLFLIADETYREIRFSGSPTCMLADTSAAENLILVDSVSKRYSMPGARIGCIASLNPEVMGAVLKFAQARLSAGTLEQFGLIPLLLDPKRYTDPVREEFARRLDVVYAGLSRIPGVITHKPGGAFYIVAKLPVKSAEEFVKFLIGEFEDSGETVMVSPIQDFYVTPNMGLDEIRIAYVLESAKLERAMEILGRGIAAYQKRT